MKKYVFSQWLNRIVSLSAILALVFVVGYSLWYLFSKPPQSKITLTNFSQIAYNDLNCDNYVTTNSSFSNQFPLSLTYKPDNARLFLNNDKDFYLATLRISNAEHVFITTKTFENSKETSSETKLLPPNKTISLEIKGDRFGWNSSIESSMFDEVKNLISPGEFPDYSNVTCNIFNECEGQPIYEFDWIPQNPSFIYSVGLCGENLKYLLRYDSATLDNLFSLGADIIPIGGEKTALIMSSIEHFGDDSLGLTSKETIVRIILNSLPDSKKENTYFGNATPSINLLFTQLSDSSIAIHDTGTSVSPGLVLNVDYLDEQKAGSDPPIYYLSSIDKIGIKANRIIVDSPKGTIIANFPKTIIPENADQLTIYSTSNNLDTSFKGFSYFRKKYEIIGNRIGATIDGREYLPSPWESIPSEIKVAYITVFVPLISAIIAYGVNKRNTINTFLVLLFSIPRYTPPVILNPEAYIFNLFSGKKIAGILDSIDGRSTHRVFILKEVREWDKDHWDVMLPSEVRIPQNQVEMYYKNTP